MKKLALALLGLVILFVIAVFLQYYFQLASDLQYISQQLGSEEDWDAVWPAFKEHFEIGMTREEVIETLVTLDPELSAELLKDNDLSCNEARCCESFVPYKSRMGNRFAHVFCYENDNLKLRAVTIRS